MLILPVAPVVKLHLSKWKELIHYVDSTQSERVQFLFFSFPRMEETYIIQ